MVDYKWEMSEYEWDQLKMILNLLEAQELKQGGWHNLNGGFAEAEYIDFDDATVFIELRSGQQDMGNKISVTYVVQLKLRRYILSDSSLSVEEKVKEIF